MVSYTINDVRFALNGYNLADEDIYEGVYHGPRDPRSRPYLRAQRLRAVLTITRSLPRTPKVQIQIPDVLSADQVARCRALLAAGEWVDGRVTAGHQSAKAKNNLQVPENSRVLPELREMVLRALDGNPLFMSATLPDKVFPPLFNRYDVGMKFGAHVDNAVRPIPGRGRADADRHFGDALPERAGRV